MMCGESINVVIVMVVCKKIAIFAKNLTLSAAGCADQSPGYGEFERAACLLSA